MAEWERVRLGEVITLDVDAVPVAATTSYDIVGVLNRGRGLLFRDPIAGDETSYKTLNRIRPEQIVYSRLKAFEGAITVTPNDLGEVYASQEFPTFTCGERILPEYFRLFTTTKRLWEQLQALSTGMGGRRERVKPADFLTIEVALPSLPEQRRIVDVMAAVDGQVEALGEELHRSLSLRVALFLSSADLQEVVVEHVANVSQGKALPKSVQGERSGELSWFKIADMVGRGNEDGYTYAETRLSPEQVESLKGIAVPAGSVVFPRVGAAVLTEKKRILDVDAAVDENHLVLTPKEGVPPECLLAATESIRLAELVQPGAVPSLNMGLIRSARIPWPAESGTDLNDTLARLRATTRALRGELLHIRTFRSALLASLINQETEIAESYDALLKGVC
ncbi:restriction endonuclease subunit S [Streptomyces sp. BG9H]|uniref:Restriction endonuclease subunit S n=1 Tax=Streptomyces anatolicus TaxID=2675858 RepID=A0ABS6YKV1_9ACTN|nr:restriction endonuclease subunit S [Streptomyces anatolicus]MBW5422045.1 restriction endonuclease subunit S [Streptomyces anatolicus]